MHDLLLENMNMNLHSPTLNVAGNLYLSFRKTMSRPSYINDPGTQKAQAFAAMGFT